MMEIPLEIANESFHKFALNKLFPSLKRKKDDLEKDMTIVAIIGPFC